jgi:hypothetical protein
MAGMALALLAIVLYQPPAEVPASNPMGYAYVKVPAINWQEIPAAGRVPGSRRGDVVGPDGA